MLRVILLQKAYNPGYTYLRNGKIVRVEAFSDRRVKRATAANHRDNRTGDLFGDAGPGAVAKLNVRDMGRGNVTGANADGRMASMSDRNRVASEQAPNPAGDGMTGGATPLVTVPLPFAPHIAVPVRVIADPKEGFISFHIENGHAVMRAAPALARDKDFIRYRGFRAIDRFLWPFDDDVFVRTSSNPKDYEHIKNGTHRGSINHATKEAEGGLSVANNTSDAVGKYAYLVRGKVIGQGSDSEPLLDLGSVKVASKRMTLGEMNKMIDDGIKKKMQALGLTDQQRIALRVAAQYDFSRMNEPSAPAAPMAKAFPRVLSVRQVARMS